MYNQHPYICVQMLANETYINIGAVDVVRARSVVLESKHNAGVVV